MGYKEGREQVDMRYKLDSEQGKWPTDYNCTASIQREILKTVPLKIPMEERGRNRQKKDADYKRKVRSQPSRSQTLQRETHVQINYLPRRSHSLGRNSLNKNISGHISRRNELIPSKMETSIGLASRLDGFNIDLDQVQHNHPMLRYQVPSLPLQTWDGAPCPVHHKTLLSAPSVVSLGTLTPCKSRPGST